MNMFDDNFYCNSEDRSVNMSSNVCSQEAIFDESIDNTISESGNSNDDVDSNLRNKVHSPDTINIKVSLQSRE